LLFSRYTCCFSRYTCCFRGTPRAAPAATTGRPARGARSQRALGSKDCYNVSAVWSGPLLPPAPGGGVWAPCRRWAGACAPVRDANRRVLRLDEQVPVDNDPAAGTSPSSPRRTFRGDGGPSNGPGPQTTARARRRRKLRGTAGNAPHVVGNSGSGNLRMLTEFRPADNVLSFFETFWRYGGEGRANEQGGPPLLQVAVSARHWDSYLGAPPVPR
jgi:hypothetical protein